MSAPLQVAIPRAVIWLLRLAMHPALSGSLQRNPVAFAAWYAAAGSVLDWPEEVERIRQSERARRLSLERMMKLLSQINYALSGHTSAEHARRVLEGYAVHDWVSRNGSSFISLAQGLHDRLTADDGGIESLLETAAPFSARLRDLGRALRLAPLEHDILAFAFLTTVADELCGIFDQLASDRWTSGVLWPAVFATSTDDLAKAMRPASPLRLSGLLHPSGKRVQFASVSPFWVDLLARADSLEAALLEPLEDTVGSGRPARMLAEDVEMAVRLLRNSTEPGINLLLYGEASLEKGQLLRDVVGASGRAAWRVRRFEEAPRGVLPSLTFVAFQVLAGRSEPSLLVIERPSEVLHTAPTWMRAMFGIELSPEDIRPFDENLLATNPVPGVWLSSDVESLPEETIARYVFHAPLKKADRSAQERVVRRRLRKLGLSRAAAAEILKLEGVSSAQLESAVKVSRLIAASRKAERDRAIVQAVRRSQRALQRDLTQRLKPPVTHYSLDYLNTSGRFTPGQILDSLRRRPKGSLLLYGPPGTGKTQFTEHVAGELRLPLVSKSASALLSKWLGESEKNIAAAFEEAAAEDGILFFDEGDSFLRSRALARNSWEVTQTNELLQHMERFDGIVIVATNLFRDLDAAALRRFTFKIEFRELDADQRWKMFVSEAGVAETLASLDARTREQWESRLLLIRQLTPGDFATVKRQSLVLDVRLTPEEWLEQLEIECALKSGGSRAAGRDFDERAA
jgi:ATPase family associated with various cellular activities (AAA)